MRSNSVIRQLTPQAEHKGKKKKDNQIEMQMLRAINYKSYTILHLTNAQHQRLTTCCCICPLQTNFQHQHLLVLLHLPISTICCLCQSTGCIKHSDLVKNNSSINLNHQELTQHQMTQLLPASKLSPYTKECFANCQRTEVVIP